MQRRGAKFVVYYLLTIKQIQRYREITFLFIICVARGAYMRPEVVNPLPVASRHAARGA